MKKHLIFGPILIVLGVMLGILKFTGLIAHMIISFVALAVLIAYTILTIKEWKIKPVEIISRVSYLIALITGIVLKAGVWNLPLSIAHKVGACLFLVLFIFTFVHQLVIINKQNSKKN